MSDGLVSNSQAAIADRRAAGLIPWTGPILMLFARSVLAIAAQGVTAAILAAQGSVSPWREAGAWMPVYGTLIDAGCIGALWLLARRERIRLVDLLSLD